MCNRACYQKYTHKDQLEKQEGPISKTPGESVDETLQVEPPPGQSSSLACDHDHGQDDSGMRTRSQVVKTNKYLCLFDLPAQAENVNHQLCQNLSRCKALEACAKVYESVSIIREDKRFFLQVPGSHNLPKKSATRRVAMPSTQTKRKR